MNLIIEARTILGEQQEIVTAVQALYKDFYQKIHTKISMKRNFRAATTIVYVINE